MSFALQCILGMQCNNFVIMAADKTDTHSIIITDQESDKIVEVSNRMIVGVVGDPGDVSQLMQYISGNVRLYSMRNRYQLATGAVVNFVRKTMVGAVRGGRPIILNMLLGGVDENGASLYIMDFLGSSVKVWYGVQGIGTILCTSILHSYYRPNLTLFQAHEVLQMCVHELHKRFIINLPSFKVKAITRDGVRVLPDINPASLAKFSLPGYV